MRGVPAASPARGPVLPWLTGYDPAMTSPSPQQAAAQLSIHRYALTAATQAAHDRLAAAAPWANWVERLPTLRPRGGFGPAPHGVTWLVTVFAVDNDAFLTLVAADEAAGTLTILGVPEANGRSH